MRHNRLEDHYKHILNQKLQPNFDVFHHQGYITLTTHNRKADAINQQALQKLEKKAFTYKAEVTGDFPPHIFPIDEHLVLKEGAQVMFVKNDPNVEKQYYNGKMGVIKSLNANEIYVHFPDENKTIEIERYEWENIRYTLNENSKEIEEEKIGTFVQYPIKLAWAITVHKSQGLTFEKAVLDVHDVFVSGQMYVAFSRLTSIDGLVLLSPFHVQRFDSHEDVLVFAKNKQDYETTSQKLKFEKEQFARNFVFHAYDWTKFKSFWQNHLNTYQEEAERSFKSANFNDLKQLYQNFLEVDHAAEKFIGQLNKIFFQHPVDFGFVHQRTDAALKYFIPLLKNIHLQLKLKLIAAQKQKRAKQYHTELLELDYQFLTLIEQLYRVVKFVKCLSLNQEINKNQLVSLDFITYHSQLKAEAITTFREKNLSTVEEDYEDIVLEKKSKPKKDKEQKTSTYDVTLSLHKENMSAEQIAENRKLTIATIYGHFAKLVSQDKIKIEEVMSAHTVDSLREVFNKFEKNTALSTIKEYVGDTFTYGELRIAQSAFWLNE